MTAKTLDQINIPYTFDDCNARLLARMNAKSLPTTDWQAGGIVRTIVSIEAQENADYSVRQTRIANAYLLSQSFGDLLDIVADEFYGCTRYPATYAEQDVFLINDTGGSVSIVAGQLTFATTDGLRFKNISDKVYAIDEYSGIRVKAEQAGIAYNGNGVISCLTPIVGLNYDSYELLVDGTDIETDDALKERCLLSLSGYSYGMSNDSYSYWARNGHPYAANISKVKVKTDISGAGIVSVYLAGPSGAISDAGMVSYIQMRMREKTGSAITLNCYSATAVPATINATITTKVGYNSSYAAAANLAVQSLIVGLDIGQTLYRSQIIEALMSPPNVLNCVLSSPAADITATDTQIISYSTPTFGTILTA